MQIDELRVKNSLIVAWQKAGVDALVKVMAIGQPPISSRRIGYCTQIKYLAGRTPAQMEQAVGLRVGSKLANGAAIYLVKPLPSPGEFHFRGYSNTPEGISTAEKPHHPDYPPGLGVPQWELESMQSNLVQLASVAAGQVFRFNAAEIKL